MVALQSAEMLRSAGCLVKIICAENSRLQDEAEAKGFDVISIFTDNKKMLKSISVAARIMRGFEPDVVHTHLSHDLWFLTPALKRARCRAKLFLTKHMASGVKKTDIFHRYLYNRVDGIFSVSNYILDSVVRTCPVPREKLFLMPNGINLVEFDNTNYNIEQVKQELGIPKNKLVISIIGRMTIGKGHEEFLQAAKQLNEKFLDDVYYLIVGTASHGEESYEEKIRSLAAQLDIQNLKFTGYIIDVKQVLAVTDILAFPSHNESFGVTIIEAMAARIPVAASGNAGVLDIVTNNINGLLFEPKNADELAASLTRLIEDKELRKRLGLAGRKTVEERFDINIITKQLLEYYQQQ